MALKIPFRLLVEFKTILLETAIHGESFRKVQRFVLVDQKNDLEFVDQILQF